MRRLIVEISNFLLGGTDHKVGHKFIILHDNLIIMCVKLRNVNSTMENYDVLMFIFIKED